MRATQAAARLDKEEVEFRHALGEVDDATMATRLEEPERLIAETTEQARQEALDGAIGRDFQGKTPLELLEIYLEGRTDVPADRREALLQHARGLIGLSSCLKGEVATGIRTEQQHKAIAAAAFCFPASLLFSAANYYAFYVYAPLDAAKNDPAMESMGWTPLQMALRSIAGFAGVGTGVAVAAAPGLPPCAEAVLPPAASPRPTCARTRGTSTRAGCPPASSSSRARPT